MGSGSYPINLKTGTHAYSFDLIELFSVDGPHAVEKCTSCQTQHTWPITTISHQMTETDPVYKTCFLWSLRLLSHSLYHSTLPWTSVSSYVKMGVLALQSLHTKWNYLIWNIYYMLWFMHSIFLKCPHNSALLFLLIHV